MKRAMLHTRDFRWTSISSTLLPRLALAKEKPDSVILGITSTGKANIEKYQHLAKECIETAPKPNDIRLFWNKAGFTRLALIQLGENTNATSVRTAAASAAALLKKNGAKNIAVDDMGHPAAAAIGAALGTYDFSLRRDQLALTQNNSRTEKKDLFGAEPSEPVSFTHLGDETKKDDFHTGLIEACAQNFARSLMECPANYMTSVQFCDIASNVFKDSSKVNVLVHDEKWIDEQRMNGLLSVNAGSVIPPRFLEVRYQGASNADDKWLALVGKGITFDAGGISLKPSANMKEMRADMGGAAVMLSTVFAIEKLQLPINVVFVTALTENLPSGSAQKPGDVIFMRNGLSVEVDNTDAEGRLVLADAIHYVSEMYPTKAVVEASTLTGAMLMALGTVYTGAFVQGEELWSKIDQAAKATDEPFWRMPFHDAYLKPLTKSSAADLCNVSRGTGGGACAAAAFVKCFLANKDDVFAHLDIAGVMNKKVNAWDFDGMSGRPVRALIELARLYAEARL